MKESDKKGYAEDADRVNIKNYAPKEIVKPAPTNDRVPPPKKPLDDMLKARGIEKYKSGGPVKSSASSRGDGCAQRGKTRGKWV